MNRRRFLIALAVVVPLAIFVAAKVATRWRPVAIGPMLRSNGKSSLLLLVASQNVVFAGDEADVVTRFDLKSGRVRGVEGVCQIGGTK